LLLDFLASALVLVRFDESAGGVVILVGALPPVRAKLADVTDYVLFQTAVQRAQFVIDRN
jgi:hypothetical protein